MASLRDLGRAALAIRSAILRPFRVFDRWPIFLPEVVLVWALAVACYAFVGIADPYELRFSRPSERLGEHPYPGVITPRLTSVVAHSGVDVVIVGGSTAVGYTPTMMRAAFRDARRPFNLAFGCMDARDYGLILPRLLQSSTLKRVIISLDYTLLGTTCLRSQTPLDARYYDLAWYDPVPEFSLDALSLSRRVVAGGELDEPGWRPRVPDQVDLVTDSPPMTTSPELMSQVARWLELARGKATSGPRMPCDAIPVLGRVLTPFIRQAAAKGVTVDLLAPPYTLASYSEWTVGVNPLPGPPFPTAMALRRCVLEQTAGLPNVYFHAFDTDLSLTANLSLYEDDSHIRDYDTYEAILKHIANRDHVLTASQWPAFEARLRQEVDTFHL
jgi:hypothetical protein